jgi:hypothetical protein
MFPFVVLIRDNMNNLLVDLSDDAMALIAGAVRGLRIC